MVEYESFERVLKDLNINDEDLKRMVSEGALRAYRDEDGMKFRKEDVEALKRSNLSDIGSAPSMTPTEVGKGMAKGGKGHKGKGKGLEVVEETDETILDLGDLSEDVDFEDTGETSVPTVDLGAKADAGELTGELVFDDGDAGLSTDADATIAMDEGLTLDDDDLGLETEPLGNLDDGDATVVDRGQLDLGEELSLDGGNDMGGQGGYMMSPPPMSAPQIHVQEKVRYVEIIPNEHWWTKAVAVAVLVVMALTMVAVSISFTKTDTMGLAELGHGFNNGPGGEYKPVRDLKLENIYKDAATTKGIPVASGSAASSATMAGASMVRDSGGTAFTPESWEKSLYNIGKVAEEYKAKDKVGAGGVDPNAVPAEFKAMAGGK